VLAAAVALALALTQSAPAPAPAPAVGPEPTPLEQHVADAELILVARVVAVHAAAKDASGGAAGWPAKEVPVAELQVTQVVLGEPALRRVFAIAARTEDDRVLPLLGPGDSGLFFLDRDRRYPAVSPKGRKVLRDARDGEPLFAVRDHGAWLTDDAGELHERFALGEEQTPAAMPRALDAARVPLVLGDLVRWLEPRLDAVTPRLEIRLATTGPYAWAARVEADGTWHVDDARLPERPEGETAPPTDGELNADEREAFRAALDVARFAELPRDVGRMKGPDESFLLVTLRTRQGVTRVRFFRGEDPDADADLVAAAREHLGRIAAALPGDTRTLRRFAR